MDRNNRDFLQGILTGILMAGIVVLAFLMIRGGNLRGGENDPQVLTSRETQEKLYNVRRIISESYLNDIDEQTIESGIFRGIAAGLSDKYADYYSPDEYHQIEQTNNGSYFGIGVTFTEDSQTGDILVVSVYESSPAFTAGVLENDILKKVDGKDITDLAFDDAINLIRAAENSEVTLTLLRNETLMDITIPFGEVEITKVSDEILPAELTEGMKIGLLTIPGFDNVTPGQFEESMNRLTDQGIEKLIIDLRDNPGGLLDSVVEIMDDLMDEHLLVSTRSRYGEEERFFSEDGRLFDGETAVLVNASSASASELLAGSLQYYEAAGIIGTETYGKGVVQSTYRLADGSAFKLTTEKYLIGGDKDIDQTGVIPDVQVQDDPDTAEDEQLLAAVQYLLAATSNM